MALSIRNKDDAAGENFLFFIGIDKYTSVMQLKNCVKDVKSLAEVLTTRYQFKYENLVLLTNEEATRENIYTRFLELIKKLKKEDSIIIFYAGMGFYKESLDEAFLIPVNGDLDKLDTCIEISVVENWLNSFKTKHVVFISDSEQTFNVLNHGWHQNG